MAEYGNDEDALVGLAWQLTDAYAEARRREDQDYACDAISDYLGEYRHVAPAEALLALLDLPLTAETFPLVDEVQTTLANRGSAVVQLLLAATLGEVYDPHGPAPERAAETLDSMDRGEVSLGLVEVLCGEADDGLKDAAVDALAALGGVAEPDLVTAIDDPVGGEWARVALEQVRRARERPDAAKGDGADDPDDDAVIDRLGGTSARDPGVVAPSGAPDRDEPPLPPDEQPVPERDEPPPPPDDQPALERDQPAAERDQPAIEGGLPTPDQRVVDDAYEDFLRRFEQGPGGGPDGPARS